MSAATEVQQSAANEQATIKLQPLPRKTTVQRQPKVAAAVEALEAAATAAAEAITATASRLSIDTATATTPTNNSNSSSQSTSITTVPPPNAGESDSGKSSSCSPALLDCSFDSGIVVMDATSHNPKQIDLALQKRIQQCQRILYALERDKEGYHLLRLRLSKLVSKHPQKEEPEPAEELCNVCCAELNLKNVKSFVKCCTCKKFICRGIKCADWLPHDAAWQCQLCHSTKESMAQTSSWVAEQMSFNQQKCVYPMRARSEIFIPISDFNDSQHIQFESVSQVGGNSAAISAEQKLKIREYVEEVVANLLGGSLDKVSVAQLSKSENYLPSIINGHNATSSQKQTNANQINNNNNNNDSNNDLSDISQSKLRQLIATIIAETLHTQQQQPPSSAVSEIALDHQRHLSADGSTILRNGSVKHRRHRTEHYFEPKVYQDLLATAVLNKIVDNQSNVRHLADSTPDLSADTRHIDENYNVERQSILSGSSIEPRSDCSYSDPEHDLQRSHSPSNIAAERESVLSDYIASHMVPLPDLSTATVSEAEEDDYASVTSSALGEGSWEDNWLFKKKRSPMPSSVSASTMSMLVPAPKEDVRAQIGDKTTDEISDLSEMGSDTEDSSLDVMRQTFIEPLNDRFLNKQLIGGQNTKMVLDELIECASITSNQMQGDQTDAPYTETKNVNVLAQAVNNTLNNEQQNDFSLLPPPSEFSDMSRAADTAESDEQLQAQHMPLPGSIAERECKKWYNAVEMPNNPYAPEALKRRISGKQDRLMDLPNISPSTEQNPMQLMENVQADISDEDNNTDIKRYSRDYYINDGKQSPQKSPTSTSPPPPTVETTSPQQQQPASEQPTQIEVNSHGLCNDQSQWHLSKPVRRSSSLQYLANRYAPPPARHHLYNHHHNNNNNLNNPNDPNHHVVRSRSNSRMSINEHYSSTSSMQQPRPATSASLYRQNLFKSQGGDDDDADDDFDDDGARSMRSWRSATVASTLPKRRALSTLSLSHSNASGMSYRSQQTRHSGTSSNVLTQFEKQLLHKDLKRNSFRAISATTKDFVVNPLFDQDKFFGGDGKPKLSMAKCDSAAGDDSGVDSCMNGFSEIDAKASNNSLLF